MGGQVLTETQATKKQFLKKQERYQVLHLATHGWVNPEANDFSYLAFSNSHDTISEQDLMYLREIYNLSTNAEMIVLSACETGNGQLLQGEGISSIARSFSYAGAKSLLATLWNVNDATTQELMTAFFTSLKESSVKDRSLQKAQIELIQNGGKREAHPFFWAPFIPVGSMESLTPTSILSTLWWLVGASLFIFFGFYLAKRFQVQRFFLKDGDKSQT